VCGVAGMMFGNHSVWTTATGIRAGLGKSGLGHRRPIILGDWHVPSYLNCGCAKTRVATPASGQVRTLLALLPESVSLVC
jgi:hypothetical protein